jgi:hypothetical protein
MTTGAFFATQMACTRSVAHVREGGQGLTPGPRQVTVVRPVGGTVGSAPNGGDRNAESHLPDRPTRRSGRSARPVTSLRRSPAWRPRTARARTTSGPAARAGTSAVVANGREFRGRARVVVGIGGGVALLNFWRGSADDTTMIKMRFMVALVAVPALIGGGYAWAALDAPGQAWVAATDPAHVAAAEAMLAGVPRPAGMTQDPYGTGCDARRTASPATPSSPRPPLPR